MGLFRREPKGRHALGAAVTSIPSGPLQGYLPPAPMIAAPAPVVVPADVVPAAEPDVMASIAELIATGEAWSTDPALLNELPALLSPPFEPVPAPAVAASAAPAVPAPAVPVPAVPAPAAPTAAPPVTALPAPAQPPVVPPPAPAPPVAAPAVVPAPTPAPARSSLEAALAELLPLEGTPEPAAVPPPPQVPPASRVQLGFRDGTSTTLDPSSTQAQALEELAQSLTRRD